jgi:hypothetical protein
MVGNFDEYDHWSIGQFDIYVLIDVIDQAK